MPWLMQHTLQVPDFLDIQYLEHRDVPVALGRVAKEAVEELVQSLAPDKPEQVESDQEAEEMQV